MIGVVVTGHGKFPEELLATAKKIVGDLEKIIVVATYPNEEPIDLSARLEKAIEKVASKEGVLVLTDVFGSSASSMCINMEKKYPIKVVTGVNLPMLLALATYHSSTNDLGVLASMIEEISGKPITG